MTSRYTASLGGKDMASINDDIKKGLLIRDISYSPPEIEFTESIAGDLNGYEISRVYYKRRTVTITFELHIYDVAKRNKACQSVNNWAKDGGVLKINDRAGQFLSVYCASLADISSARNWTDPLTITFSTSTIPFWQSDTEVVKSARSNNATISLPVDGNVGQALITMTAKPLSGMSKITFTATQTGGVVPNYSSISQAVGYVSQGSVQIAKAMTFSGFSAAAGQTLTISYTNDRYLNATVGNKSILDSLTSDSFDAIYVPCGKTSQIKVVANATCDITVRARGLWL